MRVRRVAIDIAAVLVLLCAARVSVAQSPGGCQERFNSTFELIQKVIFERHGCASANCHIGAFPAGGLDLSAAVAWDNLIDQPPQSVPTERFPGMARVVPGNKGRSLLWLNLASATLPTLWRAPLRSMPQGGLPPLSFDELDLVRMWIEYGATRDGVVPGTAELFDACLPPLRPLEVEPLTPPPPGLGLQLRAPRQTLPANSEREVCFVSYYDWSDQVPERFRGPNGDTVRYNRVDARQDPLSHHAVVIRYEGQTPIDHPIWGPFACRGGSKDGQSCQPTDVAFCGEGGVCASPPTPSLACIGFGPGDASIGFGEKTLFSTMSSVAAGREGIYEEVPLTGMLVWNSHAFNVTDEPAKLDMWINIEFAPPDEQRQPLQHVVDVSAISKMNVPAFGLEEVCHRNVLPAHTRLLEVASHVHKRGKRFRIFEGNFSCEGGPRAGEPCSPLPADPGLPVPDLCASAPCIARMPPRVGDCDANFSVTIDELVLGVAIILERQPASACMRFDGDASGSVTIDELVSAVAAALGSSQRDGEASLLYTSLTYADPLILQFDPPMVFGAQSTHAERTLTYCALYDNGFTKPDEVKRNSQVPTNGLPCFPTHCAEGRVGSRCSNDGQCDTGPGVGDGFCDACGVSFGVTTDDEMFVFIGSYVFF